jgi:hypothetical protein
VNRLRKPTVTDGARIARFVARWTDSKGTQKWLARVALLIALAVAIASASRLDDHPKFSRSPDPSVLQTVVDQGAVLAGIRLVFLFAAVFVLLSIAARVWNGHWLTKFGPAEVASEQVPVLLEEAEKKDKALRKAERTIKGLKKDLRVAKDALAILAGKAEDALQDLPPQDV